MKENKQLRSSWKGVLAVMGGGTLSGLLFHHFGRFDLARPTLLSILAIVFAIVVKWELRRRVWFWAAIVAIATLHISLILYVPWTTRWIPALVITPILAADLAIIIAIIGLLEKQFENASPRES